jgi:hypothetical protein
MGAAIVAILVCVVLAATGRGGEMARFPGDYAPPDFGAMAAVDVALLRPPTALWGYHMQVTDEALSRIATAISARDVRIATLEQQVANLRSRQPPQDAGAGPAGWPAPRGARRQDTAGEPARAENDSPEPGTWPDALTQPQPHAGGSRGWPEPLTRPQPQHRGQARSIAESPPAEESPAEPQPGQAAAQPQPDEEESW